MLVFKGKKEQVDLAINNDPEMFTLHFFFFDFYVII